MNERSRPARRLPETSSGLHRSRVGGHRAWAREVRGFSDEDLLASVRAQVSVDRAADRYRLPHRPEQVKFVVPA
jgi:hypothetical protein